MPDCSTCRLFSLESGPWTCLHVNRPGGLPLTRRALDLCALPSGANALDAAAGTGATLECLLDEYRLCASGLDLSAEMLGLGKARRPGLPVLRGDAKRVPLASGSQALVLAECSLSLIGDPDRALAEFRRLLAPGGKLALTDIYLREGSDLHSTACLEHTCCLAGAETEERIRERLERAGFTVCVWEDCTPLFKSWLAGMVFQLGSLTEFYRAISHREEDAQRLAQVVGKRFRMGYYFLVAEVS